MENSHPTNESNPIGESTTQTSAAANLDQIVVGGEEMDKNSTPQQSTNAVDEPKSAPILPVENHHFNLCNTLHRAALKGDWKAAKSIFDSDPSAVTMKINNEGSVLHIAALAGNHISFVEKLVQLTSSSDLAAQNNFGDTAFGVAVLSGAVRIAKIMADKNPDLLNQDRGSGIPLFVAVTFKRKDMASFLFSKTNFELINPLQQFDILYMSIFNDYYDIALDILEKKPELAKMRNNKGHTALFLLACKEPYVIGGSNELSFWKRYINSRFKGVYNKALMQTLAHRLVERLWKLLVEQLPETELLEFMRDNFTGILHGAATVGNVEFLIILIRSYPQFLYFCDSNKSTMFHTAVEHRQERVFSLIYEIGGFKDILANMKVEEDGSAHMLYLAAKVATPFRLNKISGAALQMQRELLWFKEVDKILVFNSQQNKDTVKGMKAVELFTKEHKQLLKDGEEWMKSTANSCMLVATLIATVVFAAAFTVPGGNDDKEGIPIFRQNHVFTVFVISDVAALLLSTTSILTFLSILTSRYAEVDFLVSLPVKLLVGLVTLFVSIVCMVVAFSATFFITYDKTKAKIPLIITALAIIPVGCFCAFHSRLVVDILHSTYWSIFSFRRQKKKLF